VLHQRLAQRTPQQRAIAHGFNLLAQHFFYLFRIIGFQTRDRQHQAVIVLTFQTINDDLLRRIVIVTLNQMFSHRYLQSNLMTGFTVLVFPPCTQPLAA
jgi:hypothetical protein